MHLFEPLQIREVNLRNRIAVSPMCQYSSVDGYANNWHLVHLGSRAVGGAGLVITEAAAVQAHGRISPQDLGIWQDEHIEALAQTVTFIHEYGAVAGIQLAHAGRKASTYRPWQGRGAVPESEGGWRPLVAPSALAFAEGDPVPEALDAAGIQAVIQAFAEAARRSLAAGFKVIEIHAAHGYLLHEFLSPLSNQRQDEYGGSFANRTRMLREVVQAVRQHWPERYPLFVRFSVTDWVEGGWDLEQSVELASQLQPLGVDLIDCSSGGLVPKASIPAGPGYQTPFAERLKATGILTAAVGMITSPQQADHIIRTGQADLVMLARELLRDPYWPLRASLELKQAGSWPSQYERAKP
ncbi:NADH:flavin oxidoreductase/NADH oxidase [Leptolyngbya sp. FACHB-261]|uniref:NADH:flavin oxidoreductase/NADH oxidase n=1 Tax=Leptolyngbya sp. FACHB-261 TaxID=2692806 RepID=UPI001685B58F|nr:NADH:flavin oxidoreductase/NADH oxidase [Leptolyngbya sp. FACHB-261]MBD2101231.1 NADH:flavin oxidoreductase/NADH oxidase [Leptolyngbya sp. FACHB-261]